jgi:Protein of unknown function (DUF2911)
LRPIPVPQQHGVIPMKRFIHVLALTSAIVVVGLAYGQQKRVSPHETVSAVIAGNRVTLTYGRPYTKSPKGADMRKIWGGLVPYGKAWRTGADEATTLITQQPIMIGTETIPAGVYTLYTVPMEGEGSKLVFSKLLGQWGIPVNEKNDVVRVDMTKSTLDKPVDQFTMAVERAGMGGNIKLMWENTQFTVPFTTVKK